MFSMAERNKSRSDTALRGKFLRRTRKNEKWLAAWFFSNLDVAPPHCLANASAECFGYGFFRGKTRAERARREFHRPRVFDFALSVNTMETSIAPPIAATLNPR